MAAPATPAAPATQAPPPRVVAQPAPTAPKTTAAPATEAPKPVYLSGAGRWSGAQAWRQGCGKCHGSGASTLDPNALSDRQWGRLLRRRSRHDRHGNLSELFSAQELRKIRAYVGSTRTQDTSAGVAGVR